MKVLFILLVGSQVLGQQVFETTPFPPPPTSFTCHGRPPGYYADLETGCKTYHVCDGNTHFTYACPKRTLFQQRTRICDHSYLVSCEDSGHFYEVETIYPGDVSDVSDVGDVGDDERILLHLPVSEESFFDEGFIKKIDEYNETEKLSPTEQTEQTEPTQSMRAEPPTEATGEESRPRRPQRPQQPTGRARAKDGRVSQSIQKFLKFRIKDSRSLFFIPEFKNNSVVVNAEREFSLPLEKNDLMRFRNRKKMSDSLSLCPTHCNPKFFLPGFCHPCIMIK